MATLIVLQGPDKGRTLKTVDDRVLIGRGSDQIPLTDQAVSRRHAELHRAEDGWTLTDLNSANGTYVNGVRLEKPTRLKHGDQAGSGAPCWSTPVTRLSNSFPDPAFPATW